MTQVSSLPDINQKHYQSIDSSNTPKKSIKPNKFISYATPTLSSFFNDRFKDLGINFSGKKFENMLNRQLQIRMFREKYYLVERHILQKRLGLIGQTDRFLLVNCVNCLNKLADI